MSSGVCGDAGPGLPLSSRVYVGVDKRFCACNYMPYTTMSCLSTAEMIRAVQLREARQRMSTDPVRGAWRHASAIIQYLV